MDVHMKHVSEHQQVSSLDMTSSSWFLLSTHYNEVLSFHAVLVMSLNHVVES